MSVWDLSAADRRLIWLGELFGGVQCHIKLVDEALPGAGDLDAGILRDPEGFL